MKRSELTVGAELYRASQYDWENGCDGYGTGKAKVLAVEPYKKSGGTFGLRAATFNQVTKGNGVLVEIDGHKYVVPLSQLRGTYEDGVRQMAERRETTRARYAQEARERETRAAAMDELRARAARMGVRVERVDGAFTISADALGRLLDFAENGGA
jgi:hypothetical protein